MTASGIAGVTDMSHCIQPLAIFKCTFNIVKYIHTQWNNGSPECFILQNGNSEPVKHELPQPLATAFPLSISLIFFQAGCYVFAQTDHINF
jgi:hypothetical protein